MKIFFFEGCPYCRKARKYLEAFLEKTDEYRKIEIEWIDEKVHPEIAEQYDYWYVPTFYINGEKAHEGPADKKQVKALLDRALSEEKHEEKPA